jgi:alcohol dehydrogenase (cytochrome c)
MSTSQSRFRFTEKTERLVMKNGMLIGLTTLALGSTTALTPLAAADMTFERALNADSEPQNWVLHHKNYQGHRFSQLTQINTETAPT